MTEVLPPEAMSLVFSTELAAKELGISIELIDIRGLTLVQRLNERLNGRPVPRISIGEEFVTGNPTKDEIIALYHHACNN